MEHWPSSVATQRRRTLPHVLSRDLTHQGCPCAPSVPPHEACEPDGPTACQHQVHRRVRASVLMATVTLSLPAACHSPHSGEHLQTSQLAATTHTWRICSSSLPPQRNVLRSALTNDSRTPSAGEARSGQRSAVS